MPDLDLVTTGGRLRVFSLLHDARALLLNFGTHGGIDVGAWVDRVCCVDARCNGVWELPAIGAVPAPTAVFVRPDGYVAWVGDGTQDGLADALARWCGAVVA
jgi:3-(3-hydroxy-phenyl)propionate hydroxylase